MSYEKLGFESGQKLKAEHLNHMEEGIANAYGSAETVLYTEQELTEEQKAQARENIGVISYSVVFENILQILKHATYDSDMSDSLEALEALIQPYEPIYKWVTGINGTYAKDDQEAILDRNTSNNVIRAMCVAENTGITLRYGNGAYTATEMSPYSPVMIPDGAKSITVRCPGFRISFNELKLVDGKWIRLFSADTEPVANEATYTFVKDDSDGLYVKLRHLTADNGILSDVPEVPDITFNY